MPNDRFIGRQAELAELNSFIKKNTASLITVKGRRRVGKTRLIDQFAKDKKYYKFTGLAPVAGLTAQDQRDHFAQLLHKQFGIPQFTTDDWSILFSMLARETKIGKVIILFDEISWMANGDDAFLSKLKDVWDSEYKSNPKLILILCSSISMWLEDNVLSSTAYFGRISWTLDLEPLPLNDCNRMLESQNFKSSAYEKFKILSVTGGVPWYIEQMQGQYSADDNIKRQCFTRGGMLVDDFDKIFHDLFDMQDKVYKDIIIALADGPLNYDAISTKTKYPKSGRLTKYLTNLVSVGFIKEDPAWSLKTGDQMQLSKYRLSDNYLRFYLKYILPRKNQIQNRRIQNIDLAAMPGWDSIMGLQFQNLVESNRHELYRLLHIAPESIIFDGPFFQNKTQRQAGCQIDFLILTKFKTIYLIEIKFSRKSIGKSVVDEVMEKAKRISLPRGMAILPILIHVNGVSSKVESAEYFHAIIDFSQMLGEV